MRPVRRKRTAALFAILGLASCGRTLTYDAWIAGEHTPDAGEAAGGGAGGGGEGGGGGVVVEIAPGCEGNEVTYTGRGPQPAPAGIPRIQVGVGSGLTGSAPWFDFSTALLTGTARVAGVATFSFETVMIRVRVDAGDSAATVVARLVKCARVPGYQFEASPPPNAFVRVRRADSRVFAHIFADNSRPGARFVFEDNEGIPYWLSITEGNQAPLMLSARGKPICMGGVPAREPTEKKIRKNEGVLFSWDGTHFTDAGACLERQMYDGGKLSLVACARLAPSDAGANPFTRPDGGSSVDCISQQAVFGPVNPGAPVAIVFNW